MSIVAPNSSIFTLYNFLDPSNYDLANDTHDMPVMQLPDYEHEDPLTDVPSDTPSPTLPSLKISTRVNFGKPPNRLTVFTNLNYVQIPTIYKQAME